MSARPTTAHYTAAQMYATNRGGGLYSEAVSQRLGAAIAAAAANAGMHPTVLTLGSLSAGLLASVAAGFGGVQGRWWLGVLALFGWQLAYAFDCADGQVARVTGKGSPYGARVDVLVDFAVQTGVVGAVVAVAAARSHIPAFLLGGFATGWVVGLFTSVLAGGAGATSLVPSTTPAVRLGKLVRDYGFVIGVLGLVVTIVPAYVGWFAVFFLVLNGAFLLASIGRAAQLSMRP